MILDEEILKLSKTCGFDSFTGEKDDEWNEEDGFFQNKRCSRVLKNEKDGQAYDIRGKVFVEPDGVSYTSRDSRVDIEFPYVPKTEYVNVEKENVNDC